MSKTMLYAGIAFAVLGCLIILSAAVLFSLSFLLPYDEREVLTQDSFAPTGVNSYRAEISTLDKFSERYYFEIRSRSGREVTMDLNLTEPGGVFHSYRWTTPEDEMIELSSIDRGVILVVLTLITPDVTLDDLEVRVYVTELSDLSFCTCCIQFFIVPIGILSLILGTVLILVRLAKGDGHKRSEARRVKRPLIEEDVFYRIRKRNKMIPYICPACDEIVDIDGTIKVLRCPHCRAPVDLGILEKLVGGA